MKKQMLLRVTGTIASRAFCTLLTLLTGIATAWLSDKAGLGNLYLLISGASIAGALLAFGHPSNLTKIRRSSPEKSDEMIIRVICIVVLSAIALLTILFLLGFVKSLPSSAIRILLWHSIVAGMGVAILKCLSGDLKGAKRSELAIFVEFGLANLLYISLLFCWYTISGLGVNSVLSGDIIMLAYTASNLAAVAFTLVASGHLGRIRYLNLRKWAVGPQWAFWGNSLLNMTFMASPVFVAAWLGDVETSATVGVVQRIVGVTGSIRVSLAAYYMPRFVIVASEPSQNCFDGYRTSCRAMAIAFIPVLIVSLSCGRILTSLFNLGSDISILLAATASIRFLDALTGTPQQFLEMNGLGKLEFHLGLMSIGIYVVCLTALSTFLSPEFAICISVSTAITFRSFGGWAAIRRLQVATNEASHQIAGNPRIQNLRGNL